MVGLTKPRKVRVLVAEDSAVIRNTIKRALDRHSEIEIVSLVVNGLLALEAFSKYKPDVVTLDIDMPEMDGISVLKELRKLDPKLPVIMLSNRIHIDDKIALSVLIAGANDYVGMPGISAGSVSALKVLEEQLVPKIIGLGRRQQTRATQGGVLRSHDAKIIGNVMSELPTQNVLFNDYSVASNSDPSMQLIRQPVKAVCMGVSTGGPMALMQIFSQFKVPLPVPIFIVQHMPPSFTKSLADRLDSASVMKVIEPCDGEFVSPGIAYLAPGGLHMTLKTKGTRTQILLKEDPPVNSCRPSVDVLFRSASEIYGKDLLAVILTGMGYDGLQGCEAIRKKFGQVIAQDEATSIVWGMPGAVVQNNLADKIIPVNLIANEIVFRTRKVS